MKRAIVIGGGIAGCSTAYALSNQGVRVTLIERNQAIASEASGNPVAMLYPKLDSGSNVLSAIATQGFNFTTRLLETLNQPDLYDACGQIQLATTAKEEAKQSNLLNSSQGANSIQLLSASEASEIANIPLNYGGLYLKNASWIKPKALCEALIRSQKITLVSATEALQIKKMPDGWQVRIGKDNQFNAEIVVCCNANDLPNFSQCAHIPLTPVRGQINFFPENDISAQINTVICSNHYLSPSINGTHSIGTTYAPNDSNPNVTVQDTHANLRALKAISPALFNRIDFAQVSGRVAWRSATRDYIPLAGQIMDAQALINRPPRPNDSPSTLPWLDGLYVNAGHGSKGMITAPMCAALITHLCCDTPAPLSETIVARLNPNRFLLRGLGLKEIAQNLYGF